MLQGIKKSLAVLKPCYRGSVTHPLLLILLDNFIVLQGTKVLEDREIRRSFCYVTEGTPRQYAPQSIIKYTGTRSVPQWMDIERGDVLSFSNNLRGVFKSSR